MAIVSIYPHIKEVKKGETMSLHEILEAMRDGHWKDKIVNLRERIAAGASEDEIRELKDKLPYFTVSGAFKVRNDKGLIQHSGKLAIDFDKIEEEERERVRNILINDKYTEYVFTSCSGRGYCIIVNIDPRKHLDSFLFLEKYYSDSHKLGKYFDKGTKDISRPRFISYDENLFHNPEYEIVTVPENFSTGATTTIDSDDEKFEWVKSVIDKKESFVEGNRHRYMVVMAYFLNKCGVSQEYTLQRYLSEFLVPGKDEKEIQRIVRDCYKNHLDFGTFVINKKLQDLPPEFQAATKHVYAFAHGVNEAGRMYTEADIQSMCAQYLLSVDIVKSIFKNVFNNNQDSFDLDHKPEIYKIELFIKKRYEIIRNEVTQRIEYRKRDSNTKLEKLNTDTINRDIQHAGFKFTLDKLKSLLRSDFVENYNPFKNYFENLPEWLENEEPDYITELAGYIKTDNDPFWHAQFKKALVRCIACSLDYRENRIIITLVGQAQETGKSNFIRFLCPDALNEYYTETAMDGGKDSDLQLSENFLWNLEELAALHNNEINKLKAIISKANVKQRRAYAEFHDSNPRRVNFWASTNKTEFLTDDQNTRWLCFNVLSIDHNYNNFKTGVRKVNINNVWAQAYTLYKNGFDFTLTAEEAAMRDSINRNYELSSTEKELIIQHFKPAATVGTGEFLTNTDILIRLQNATDNKIKLRELAIGKALRQLEFPTGYKKINGKSARGFWCIPITALTPSTSEDIFPYNNIEIEPREPKPF